jgi:hypothetical protein
MGKEKDTILTSVKGAVVDTGVVVVDTAKAGFKGAKDLAVTAGGAVGEAVSTVAKRARRVVSKRRSPKQKAASKRKRRKAVRTKGKPSAAVSGRGTTRKSAAKKPTRKRAKPKKRAISAKTGRARKRRA